MKKFFGWIFLGGMTVVFFQQSMPLPRWQKTITRPPNILFAIADDQSFPHASIYGQSTFRTPIFDRIASNGILFSNAFVAAPQCSPSRAAILTGRQIWQLEEAGTHSSYFPKKFPVFTDALEGAGYFLGFTGKPWGPGNFKDAGWNRNPVGPEFNKRELASKPTTGISNIDYVANFKDFLDAKPADKPFFFWYGGHEPHRTYEAGSGAAVGKTAESLKVPGFLPNTPLVQNDLLDYALEIEWFDTQLGKMLQLLEAAGELDNTLVVVTADNGMPFPYAKANLQELGTHVPLAICGPMVNGKNRKVNDMVSLIDLAPTFLDLAQIKYFEGIAGKSLLPIFNQNKSGEVDHSRQFVFTGRERHTHARPDNVGYPARAVRTKDYLYVKNFKSERWPVGDPAPEHQASQGDNQNLKPIELGYEDIDDSPTKAYMIQHQTDFPELFRLGFEKRAEEELFNINKDPYCLHDISRDKKMQKVRIKLKSVLEKVLISQSDPRMTDHGDIFDSYPRFGLMRPFEGFKERGKYNEKYMNKN
ncbi:MAG: sulfatase [Saprospiraceae bacterium]